MGTQAQDTSAIQNYIAQQHQQSRAASASDASRPAGQEYTYPNDTAYAAQQAPSQSAQAAFYQTNALAGATIDVQALLDSLTPVGNNAPPGQYAASQLPAQSQPSASASSLPNAASNLPPRPPAQDKLATHPNYNPNDDIRSFHPHSQKAPAAQQRGSGQVPALTLPTQAHTGASQPGAQSPVTPGQGQRQPSHGEMADDEDSRWPPEINRKYEDFLDQERKFVTEGQWDQFPLGSRLFIGKSRLCLWCMDTSNFAQAIFLPRRSRNEIFSTDSIVTASSRKSQSNKRMALFSSWIRTHVVGRWMLNRARQCVVGRCVSGN